MTPPHGIPLDDSDPNLPAQPDPQAPVTREGLKLAILNHKSQCHEEGPVKELQDKVDKLRMWVAGATMLGAVATVLSPVILAWWLSSRFPAPQSQRASESTSLVKSAHAETKGVSQ